MKLSPIFLFLVVFMFISVACNQAEVSKTVKSVETVPAKNAENAQDSDVPCDSEDELEEKLKGQTGSEEKSEEEVFSFEGNNGGCELEDSN